MSDDVFNNLAAAICDKHENILQEVCQVPRVTDLKDFYKFYEQEENRINENYDKLPRTAPSIEAFAAAFKQFEEFPANLKAKRAPPIRERLNSTISRSSPSLNDSINSSSSNQKESSISLLNLNKNDDVPTASETLNSFNKFLQQLKLLNAELKQQNVEKEYVNKLKQLSTFASQLEKLLPTEKVGKSALTPEEENILMNIVGRIDDMNFIHNHQCVFRQHKDVTNSDTSTKLDGLVDILSYCLLAINSFNIN